MAIDTKSIQDFLWKVFSFSMKNIYDFAEKYPKTCFVSISIFLLYIFFPLVLIWLICFLLVSAIAVVLYRVYFRADLEGFENIIGYKKTDDKPPIVKDNDTGKNVIRVSSQSNTARRRNVNEKDRESYAQSSIKDKDVASPSGLNDDLVDKNAVVEEKLKEIREVNIYSGNKKAGPSSSPRTSEIVASPPFTSGCLKEATLLSGVKAEINGESSDDSEEDAREYRNKAVEWNVDDQMNISHVGNIEMERNTRLENLIARRKARKLLDIQVRNTLMRPATTDPRDHLPSLITEKKNHFLACNSEMSPIPGSAPSVLLPMHKSPFDISFDPEADKPIPTRDNFEKEILADQQKESTFCRHESFGRNSFSPIKSLQDRKIHEFSFHHGLPEKSETSKTGGQSDSTQENKEDGSEVEKKQIVHEKIDERSRPSSSLEETLSGANKDKLLQSLSSLAQKDIDADRYDNDQEIDIPYNSDRLLYEKTEGNSFFGDKRTCHAPSNSLASDLQVEVSEVGSPQSTSSNEKSHIFDDYINKEVTSGSEDLLADSFHLSGVDMNESETREVNEVSKQEITDADNLDPNTSDLQPGIVVRQEEISSHSQPLNLPDSIQGQISGLKQDHLALPDPTDAPTTNYSEHSTKEVVANASASANLEDPSASQNIIPTQDSEPELSVKHVDVVEPSNAINLKSSRATDENVRKIVGDDNVVDTKATEEIKNIDSDVKTEELQQAEPHKDISQHLAGDGKDNSETIKVVESESRTSTPIETVVASKQSDLIDDSGKIVGHLEVKLDPHQGKSTVESDGNETIIAAEEKEKKPET